MSLGNVGLDTLQRRILEALADFEPRWTLVGGGALAGFHLHHRTTRDLDLFWRGLDALGRIGSECAQRLRGRGFEVATLQNGLTFSRLKVGDGLTATVLDLVADPSAAIELPEPFTIGTVTINVSSIHDLLVDKLCALLSRAEIRDLVDVRALMAAGADLDRALADAPLRDAGFSPLTLTWGLQGLSIESLARSEGLPNDEIASLASFRTDLVARLARKSRPGT